METKLTELHTSWKDDHVAVQISHTEIVMKINMDVLD